MFLLLRDVLTGLLLSHLEDGMSVCSGTGLALRETLQWLFKPLHAAYHGIIVPSIPWSIFSVGGACEISLHKPCLHKHFYTESFPTVIIITTALLGTATHSIMGTLPKKS